MATKIRLQRHGRKGYAYYHIVIADSRAPRDGRFIERIGSYNPNTDPATIDLNFERALYWVNVGAQPTDTVRNILSNEGIILMKHLQNKIKKGAFDEAAAQKKFDAWKADKEKVLSGISEKNKSAEAAKVKARLDAEKAINKARAAELSKKRMEALEAEAAAAAEAAKEAAAETETEAKAEETPEVSETPEAPAAE